MYWINTWSKGALVKQKDEPIVARGSLNVDSYFGHSFLVVEDKVRAYTHVLYVGGFILHCCTHETTLPDECATRM